MKRIQCREQCGKGGPDRDGYFTTQNGENIHYLRAHTQRGKMWKQGRASKEQPVSLINRVAAILQNQPEGMHLSEITAQLRKQGSKIDDKGLRAQISAMAKKDPGAGVVRVRRGIYGLATDTAAVTQPDQEVTELPHAAQIIILQHENQQLRDVLLRTIQAMGEVTLLATTPADI